MELCKHGKCPCTRELLNLLSTEFLYRGSWGSTINCLEPKIESQSAKLACPNLFTWLYLLKKYDDTHGVKNDYGIVFFVSKLDGYKKQSN
jgi:hypothetical protein